MVNSITSIRSQPIKEGGWAEGRYYGAVTGQASHQPIHSNQHANQWAHLNQDGLKVTGLQNINNKVYCFGSNGAQVKVSCSLSKVRNATLMPTHR